MTQYGENFDKGQKPDESALESQLQQRYMRFSDSDRHDFLRQKMLDAIADAKPPKPIAPAANLARKRFAGLLRTAAMVAVAMGLSWLVGTLVRSGDIPANKLFAGVAENIRTAAFVIYDQSVSISGGDALECRVQFNSDGQETRRFADGTIQQSNYMRGRILYLPAGDEFSVELMVPPEQFSGHIARPWLLLRDMADTAGDILPDKQPDGTLKFVLNGSDGNIEIYTDSEDLLPVRVNICSGNICVKMSGFEWGGGEDADTIGDITVDIQRRYDNSGHNYVIDMAFIAEKPSYKDLAEMTRILVELNGGSSPGDISTDTVKSLIEPLEKTAEGLTDMGSSMSLFTGPSRILPDGRPSVVASLESLRDLIRLRRGLEFLSGLCRNSNTFKYYPDVPEGSAKAVFEYKIGSDSSAARIYADGSVDFGQK